MINKDSMSEKLINRIQDLQDKLNKGMRISGREVTDVYNEVFGTRLPNTNCASCLKKRIGAVYNKMLKEKDNAQQK